MLDYRRGNAFAIPWEEGLLRALILLLLCGILPGATLKYWVQPCEHPGTICQAGDPELAQWAVESADQRRFAVSRKNNNRARL